MEKLKFYSKYTLAYLAWALYTFSTPVNASAVSDIMNNERFQGAIESIEWLTTRVDYYFTMIISATAFFIISAALLKNACAGAYCANHKFWDKVADAHEKMADKFSVQGLMGLKQGWKQISASGIGSALLAIVPNIKAMTDFEDADIEPKQYFMKAIPQMLLCVIIGVFIYNGYYRDTASLVGNFGSEICNRVFSSVDPGKFLDKLSQTTSTPENIYEKDPTLQGKDIYQLSTALYKACLSSSKDLTSKEAKTSLMRSCESTAYNILKHTNMTQFYNDSRLYDWTISNLNVTLTGNMTPEFAAGVPNTQLADQSNQDLYTVQLYASTTSVIPTEYLGSENSYAYITFNMVGSEKTVLTGLTSITATEGAWKASGSEVIELSVSVNNKGVFTLTNTNGTNLYTGTVSVQQLLLSSGKLKTIVSDWCTSQGGKLQGDVQLKTISGGNLNSTQIKFDKEPVGSAYNGSCRVSFKMSKDNGNPTSEILNINWSLTLAN